VSRSPLVGWSGVPSMGAEVSTVPPVSVAVLSPHLDDAVLSTWSVLRGPGPVTVVNVCAGVPPSGPPARWDRLTGARDAAERMRERLAEDRAALARSGREAVYLDFLDNQYRAGPIEPHALTAALAGAVADVHELWAPAGIGGHPDHVQVREAALAFREDGGPPVRIYAELPYAARWGWPEWVTGRRARQGLDVEGWLNAFLPEGTPVPGERHVLPRAEARRKLSAVRDYETQWPALEVWFGRAARPRAILRYEASFAAAPAISRPAPSTRARTPGARRRGS
jgi:LmbE family N-acetylglucosaminyl deacetylase